MSFAFDLMYGLAVVSDSTSKSSGTELMIAPIASESAWTCTGLSLYSGGSIRYTPLLESREDAMTTSTPSTEYLLIGVNESASGLSIQDDVKQGRVSTLV